MISFVGTTKIDGKLDISVPNCIHINEVVVVMFGARAGLAGTGHCRAGQGRAGAGAGHGRAKGGWGAAERSEAVLFIKVTSSLIKSQLSIPHVPR